MSTALRFWWVLTHLNLKHYMDLEHIEDIYIYIYYYYLFIYYFYLFSVLQQRTSAPFSPKFQRKYNFDVRMTYTFKVRPYFSRLWGSFCIERCSKSLLSNRLIQLTLQHKEAVNHTQPHSSINSVQAKPQYFPLCRKFPFAWKLMREYFAPGLLWRALLSSHFNT